MEMQDQGFTEKTAGLLPGGLVSAIQALVYLSFRPWLFSFHPFWTRFSFRCYQLLRL